MFKCNHCNKEYNTFNGLAKHSAKSHNISGMELYMLTNNITEIPKCKCGCNQDVNFQLGKFGEFIRGHKARLTKGFYSKEGLQKAAATRKKQFESGERIQWNKGKKYNEQQLLVLQEAAKAPERRKKISQSLTGKKKSPEHIAKIQADRKKYWSDQTNRDAQRIRRVNYMNAVLRKRKTRIEKDFESILELLKIKYIFQYAVNGYNYDFFLPDKNILIEVDGDWWHCNPKLGIEPIHECQKHTMDHDRIKNHVAAEHGYQLFRFWENDIVNDRFTCVNKLMEIVSS